MSNLIKKEDVANWMFENRMCTSIHNAYDKLKELPMVDLADHDKQIVETTFKVLNQALKDLGHDTIPRFILDGVADRMKGEK